MEGIEHDSEGVVWDDEQVYHMVRVVAGTMRRVFKFDNSRTGLVTDTGRRTLSRYSERQILNTNEGIYQ